MKLQRTPKGDKYDIIDEFYDVTAKNMARLKNLNNSIERRTRFHKNSMNNALERAKKENRSPDAINMYIQKENEEFEKTIQTKKLIRTKTLRMLAKKRPLSWAPEQEEDEA